MSACDPFLPLHGSNRQDFSVVKLAVWSLNKALLACIFMNFSHHTQSQAQSNTCNARSSIGEVSYRIVQNFRGTKLLWFPLNCKFQSVLVLRDANAIWSTEYAICNVQTKENQQ